MHKKDEIILKNMLVAMFEKVLAYDLGMG